MSLIDIICVGQAGSPRPLASLVPATLVFNFINYGFYSISSTTTTLLSRDYVAEKTKRTDGTRARRIVNTGLVLASSIGLVLASTVFCIAPRLVKLTGATAEVASLANDYIQLRALAAPTVLVSMVAQSALIAWRRPALASVAVWVSCVLNCSLDYILILKFGWGVAGAAVATTSAQLLACILLLRFVELSGPGAPSQMSSNSDEVVRPASTLRMRMVTRREVSEFFTVMLPLMTTAVGKNLAYLLITSRAAKMQVSQMASHQPVWQMYAFLSFSCSVLSNATIIFAPGFKTRFERSEFSRTMLALGAFTGAMTGLGCVVLFNLVPFLFTPDSSLWPTMANVAPMALVALSLNGIDTVQEGMLIVNGEAKYLGIAMWFNCFVVLVYTSLLNIVFSKTGVSVFSVWSCLVVFFSSRVILNMSRIRKKQFLRTSVAL